MLIACLACGKRISDRAPACPFCGTKAAAPAVSQLHPEGAPAVSSLAPEAGAVGRLAPPHLVDQIQDARRKIQELKPS